MTNRHKVSPPIVYRGFWTVPNMVTLGRPVLFFWILRNLLGYINHPPVHWKMFWGGAVVLAVDALDGLIARTFNQRSKIGMMLDPTMDKVVNNACLVSMTWVLYSRVSGWYVVALIVMISLRLCQDAYSTWLYWLGLRAGTIRGAPLPAKIKGWTELIGVALAYAFLVKQWPGGATSSAQLILVGCSLALVFAFISLKQKRRARKALM